MDHSGQVFTIDAMFALLLITVIIGLSANSMDIAGNKACDYSTEQSMDRIAGDTADMLIKTPGSPENWEELKSFKSITPGLAKLENGTKTTSRNILDMNKISCLKKNPDLLKKILPSSMSYSLMIYPVDPTLPTIEILNKTPPLDVGDVLVINRTVIYDYNIICSYLSITPDIHNEINGSSEFFCTHSNLGSYKHNCPDFKTRNAGWICRPFNIDLLDINSKDFYILTDPTVLKDNSARWIIDTPNIIDNKAQNFTSAPIMVNSMISELSGNKSREIFVFHVYTDGNPEKIFNTYLVGVPKGTQYTDVRIDHMKSQHAFFILKLWM